MENNYSVRAIRVTTSWFGTRKFYQPIKHDERSGNPYCFQDSNDMTSVWGYDTEDEAWKVVDAAIHQDYCDEAESLHSSYDRCPDSGREDFHVDG
jgi:uncharacterized protein YtpQ (UPF0354 family)